MKKRSRALSFIAILLIALATSLLSMQPPSILEKSTNSIEPFSLAQNVGDKGRRIDWHSLPDEVVAWVEVPGTSIDEPIVQARPDAPDEYLYKDARGQGAYGTPYIDAECSLESNFKVIYGHHMYDGTVFADFASFSDKTYAQNHSRIIVYERDGDLSELEVIAVDVINANYEKLKIPFKREFQKRIETCDLVFNNASKTDELWAFVTCSYETSNSRTVIFAAKKHKSSPKEIAASFYSEGSFHS